MLFFKRINRTKKVKKKNMRARFVSRNYISFLTVTIIPMLVIGGFYKRKFSGYIEDRLKVKIEISRDRCIENIKNEYEGVEFKLEHFSKTIGKKFIEEYYTKNSKIDEIDKEVDKMHGDTEMFRDIEYIKNIYIWDWELKEIYSMGGRGEYAKERLSKAFFSEVLLVDEFTLDENREVQLFFYKITEKGNLVGYTAIEIDSTIFEDGMSFIKGDESVYILNEEYKVIYATDKLIKGKKIINDITKDMLDGYKDTNIEGRMVNSYGFVDFQSSSLYVNVQEGIDDALKPLGNLKIFVILIFSTAILFSGVVFYRFNGRIHEYSSNYVLSEEGFGESHICREIVSKLEQSEVILENIIEKEKDIKKMKSEISDVIKEFKGGGKVNFEKAEKR